MDPRKNFVCKARGHIINDSERPWGNQSECPYCKHEKMLKEIESKEIESKKESKKKRQKEREEQ